jgi:hypothetical protein
MSFLFTQAEKLTATASDLAGIGSTISAVNVAAALPTTGVPAPGADAVSALVAEIFGAHGQQHQAISARAAFHDQFVQDMKAAGHTYADTEAANASRLRQRRTAGAERGQCGQSDAVGSPARRRMR